MKKTPPAEVAEPTFEVFEAVDGKPVGEMLVQAVSRDNAFAAARI